MGTVLDNEEYIQVETFKKDGTGVKTPVWSAPLDGKLVFGTDGGTYKAKRIRNNPKVRVAACNASGAQIRGPWTDGTARLLDAHESKRADAALDAKYRWKRRAFQLFAKIVGRIKDPVFFEITLAP